MRRIMKVSLIGILIVATLSVFAYAQTADYCCEKTNYGAWCQNTKQENCQKGFGKVPTSCDATSYCKGGCCYDSSEGLCMENTPQRVCNDNEGTWLDSKECDVPQCELGCCVLDTQAAFVTLTRCKKLSGFYGVETDFRLNVGSEVDCIAITQLKDRGACVFEDEFTRTCKFTTREECQNVKSTGNMTQPEFFKDYLCSAEELATNCGPTTKTTCVEGKDGVYFKDTCGNPANIYDASKKDDKSYWKKIIDRSESCGFGNNNANSKSCGNCDYYLGSLCKEAERGKGATYGDYICKDLNCYDTSDGKDHRHGESWCSYDSNTGEGKDAVGSRHVRHLCVAGEELTEPCADYRQKVCVESETKTTSGTFQEANCIVNRWKDCAQQDEKEDCENTDKRDCVWKEGASFIKSTEANTGQSGGVSGLTSEGSACVPDVPPGLKFWEEGEAEGICSIASAQCVVTFEKGVFDSKEPTENEECLTEPWAAKMNEICTSIGDCGGYVNWQGKYTSDGYKWLEDRTKKTLGKGITDLIKSKAGV